VRFRTIFVALLLCIARLELAVAQGASNATSPTARDSGLTVTLVTFGLGQEVFERFGHNALMFHDPNTMRDSAFHWGLFSFSQPGFLLRFLTGDTSYWMGAVDGTSATRTGSTATTTFATTAPRDCAMRSIARLAARSRSRQDP
jgi:hypothetical protein